MFNPVFLSIGDPSPLIITLAVLAVVIVSIAPFIFDLRDSRRSLEKSERSLKNASRESDFNRDYYRVTLQEIDPMLGPEKEDKV